MVEFDHGGLLGVRGGVALDVGEADLHRLASGFQVVLDGEARLARLLASPKASMVPGML